jgi:tetratricopeptide (TPR) repeat protein/SAM-dependent methyltransferase
MTSKSPDPSHAATGNDMFGAAVRNHQSGRLAEAEALYRKILGRDPSHVGSLHFLGLLAHQTGRNDDAAKLIGRALTLNGAIPDCHYHMGLVQSALGRLDAAATHFAKTVELKPDHAEAHMDLGTILKRQGRPDAALASYRRALALRPDAAQIHYNLANLLDEQGRRDEAIGEYQQALRLAPTAAPIHHNLAAALLAQGNLIGAVAEYQEALRCDPKLADAGRNIGRVVDRIVAAIRAGGGMAAKTLFVHCVENLNLIPDEVDLRAPLIEALTEPWGRPSDLLSVAKAVLQRNPAIRRMIERTRQRWPARLAATQLFADSDRTALAEDALLRCLLESTRLSGLGFERVLTNVRAIVLDETASAIANDDQSLLAFHAALAQQCYLNDYVYDLPDGELARAQELRDRLAAALRTGDPIPPIWPVAVASYFPLGDLRDGKMLLARSWPPPVVALLAQQIVEPAEEERLRETMPRLTPIENQVSLEVQRQYAENPYPRWAKLPLTDAPMTLDEHLGALFPHMPFCRLGKSAADILIAGCGTGQQALDAANLFAASRLLAIDLSLPSLAFAQRKARELGIGNLEFAQADILQLESLNRSFDSIEAMGVLHHLADPWAGWAVLLGRLGPGGVMRIGLYSELGRAGIVKARKIVAERGFRATADDIRRARQELIAVAADQQLLFVRDSWDFFSISECRDLLFHVQEHRMTLPQIKAFLAAHDLQFLGFELAEPLWRAYGARFPADTARIDLDHWHRFETENPSTFGGMYQFWVQKPGA